MEWIDNMNEAMNYIEENLSEDISYDYAAKLACCSTYHFQRMFSYITGVPLSEYIRRRRLTLAAFELQGRNAKVIDTALKYGYESPEAFSRAFKKMHGVMPISARDIGVSLKAYPKMTFSITIKGDDEMKYRITQRESFKVFGVYTEISNDADVAFTQVPEFFSKCDEEEVPDKINELLGQFPDTHTISALYDYKEDSFKYMIGQFLPKNFKLPEKYTVLDVPAATWAVFDTSCDDIQNTWRRVWTEWFPTSAYETADGPQFEMYYGLVSHENLHCEIWVPVRKKN